MTTVTLPADSGTRRYVGPADLKPAGTQVGATEYAVTHVLLVDATNAPLLVAVDLDSGAGTASRAGVALLVPASGGPAVVGGDTANGLDVDVTRLPSLPSGANAIGTVGVTSLPHSAAVTITHSQPSVTTASTQLLAANASRRYSLLQNMGAVDVFVTLGAAAVANQGICLKANGGYYELGQAFGNLTTGAVNAIVASGTATVLVTEGV